MVFKLYDSLEKKKKEFIPISKDRIIRIYTCGMTTYDHSHIGHAKTYSSWDILTNYIRYRFSDHKVMHVQNYTDVGHLTDDADEGEDKIIKKAIKSKEEPMELVDKYIRSFEDDMRDLNIRSPNILPRATGHIVEMIVFVKSLLNLGIAYETERGIYFDISKFPQYSEFTNINLDKQQVGARVIEDTSKRNPYDFALFIKAPKEHIMQWETPWGWNGFPGWHIECSTMGLKYLGDSIDIHAGGIEHLAIHHPNERAQTESLTGKNWVNFWLHANHMLLNGEKMAKSTGNLITTRDAINRFGTVLLRYYLVTSTHYRSQDDFTEEKILQKREEYQKILGLMKTMELIFGDRNSEENQQEKNFTETALNFKKEFIKAMDNDLDTVLAGKILLNFVNYLNKCLDNEFSSNGKFSAQILIDYQLFVELASLLAINKIQISETDNFIKFLLNIRKKARIDKKFKEADHIRDEITLLGYLVEDKPWGSIFYKKLLI